MRDQQKRSLDHTGLNMIRIVIGSYFMAIALGLIQGIEPPVLFLSVTDAQTADLLGTVLLFAVTVCFMVGIYLRLTSLMLAIFVLASSVVQNFVLPAQPQVEPFWRDITLVCAVLLAYTSLKRSELRSASLVMRRTSRKLSANDQIAPRRVSVSSGKVKRGGQPDYVQSMKPLMRKRADGAPPLEMHRSEPPLRAQTPKPQLVAEPAAKVFDDEVENIFAVS